MIFCGRCDTWCYDLHEHQDNGECELIRRLRQAESEVKCCANCTKYEKTIENLENEFEAQADELLKLKRELRQTLFVLSSGQRFTAIERMR